MEVLPLLHFNLVMKYCNLWLLFMVSVACFSSYCGAWKPPFTCGGGCRFKYPFGERNSGWGDPLLQLDCDNSSNMPLLDINGTQYYIVDTYSVFNSSTLESMLMTIINKNLKGSDCDPSSGNCTTQFWSSDNLHIVNRVKDIPLWEGCQNTLYYLNKSSELGCIAWFYYNTSSDMSRTEKCKSQVQQHAEKDTYLEPITMKGLEIKWTPSTSCKRCIADNGWCNYDANIKSKPVLCKPKGNDSHTTDNDSHRRVKSSNRNAPLRGYSIGGAVAVAVCVFLFLIYYVKRRKVQPIRGIGGINNYHQRTEMDAAVGNLPIFTYEELQQATDCFHENKKLGDGGFGSVYLGHLEDGRTVAIKRLYQQNSRIMELFINEVKILSSLHHPNLVQLYGCTYPQSPVLLLVYEFIPNGTLADHLHGSRRIPKGLPWEIRLNIAIETAQALSFLHGVNPPIFHRDVKSTNILLDENYRTKVADFGLSRLVPVNVSHVSTAPQGTPGYVDPEYHQCFQLTEKSDVYSFGVVLVEIISAKLAVDTTRNKNEISLANMATQKIGTGALHELVDPELKTETNHEVKAMVSAVAELAFRCLTRDGDSRPDMKEVVQSLEEIRLPYEKSDSEEQSSTSKEYSIKMPVSPSSVHEEWPSMESENSV